MSRQPAPDINGAMAPKESQGIASLAITGKGSPSSGPKREIARRNQKVSRSILWYCMEQRNR